MHNAAELIHSPDQMPEAPFPSSLEVQRALAEILKSVHFRGSKQSQQLLQYIVTQSLDGHAERLKERIIGAEVFGRPVDYDTNVDPIVRSRAAEVRKRLAQYYVEEGKDSPVRIKFSPGSYLANFSDSRKPIRKRLPARRTIPFFPSFNLKSLNRNSMELSRVRRVLIHPCPN